MSEADLEQTVGALRAFAPYSRLDRADLLVLAARTQRVELPARAVIFPLGDARRCDILLLEGTIELRASDGRSVSVAAGTPTAGKPVSPLLPRQHQATALGHVALLRVDTSGLADTLALTDFPSYSVDEIDDDAVPAGIVDDDLQRHHDALLSQPLSLPTLPEVAVMTRRLIDQDVADVGAIARIVERDAAIAAKLIKSANSPLFRGQTPVHACEQAILRLGTRTTRQLVVVFSMRELFRTNVPALRARMQALWHHSNEVAAICLVIARITGRHPPDEALLAGLVHDIGVLPIYDYASRAADLAAKPSLLDAVVGKLRGRCGVLVLREWGFPDEFVRAAADAEDWLRDPAPEADMADLVIVAQVHAYLGKPSRPQTPPLVQLPAFRKLAGDDANPALSERILAEAAPAISEANSLLAI